MIFWSGFAVRRGQALLPVGHAARGSPSAGTRKAGKRMFARKNRLSLLVITGALTLAGSLTACGDSGSSGTEAPASAAAGAGCAPIAGEQLVLLADDKKLQNSDNIVAVFNTKAGSPALVAATDKVA